MDRYLLDICIMKPYDVPKRSILKFVHYNNRTNIFNVVDFELNGYSCDIRVNYDERRDNKLYKNTINTTYLLFDDEEKKLSLHGVVGVDKSPNVITEDVADTVITLITQRCLSLNESDQVITKLAYSISRKKYDYLDIEKVSDIRHQIINMLYGLDAMRRRSH